VVRPQKRRDGRKAAPSGGARHLRAPLPGVVTCFVALLGSAPFGRCTVTDGELIICASRCGNLPRSESRMEAFVGRGMRIWISGLFGAIAVVSACPVDASVDRSRAPSGVYALKPGIYVQKGIDCGSPPNAAIRHYDGKGLSTAHTRACVARILSHKGKTFSVSQSCIDAGAGPAPRFSEGQTVEVYDALTFKLRVRGPGTVYRYCPPYLLPRGLRSAAAE